MTKHCVLALPCYGVNLTDPRNWMAFVYWAGGEPQGPHTAFPGGSQMV